MKDKKILSIILLSFIISIVGYKLYTSGYRKGQKRLLEHEIRYHAEILTDSLEDLVKGEREHAIEKLNFLFLDNIAILMRARQRGMIDNKLLDNFQINAARYIRDSELKYEEILSVPDESLINSNKEYADIQKKYEESIDFVELIMESQLNDTVRYKSGDVNKD